VFEHHEVTHRGIGGPRLSRRIVGADAGAGNLGEPRRRRVSFTVHDGSRTIEALHDVGVGP
jgi:hypothetical protein